MKFKKCSSNPQEGRKRKQKQKIKMADISLSILIITLAASGLNAPVIRQRLAE